VNKLQELLATKPIDMAAVGDRLDSLSHEERIAEVRSLGLRLQRDLFNAADGNAIDLEHFVPRKVPNQHFVKHYGKNSLPVFTTFEKHFARPMEDAKEWWGFNESGEFVKTVIGPGWFITRKGDKEGEVDIDYYRIPGRRLEGGPPLKENTSGLSYFVYGNMVDVMRKVSDHVSVGNAIKNGSRTDNYFVLCREPLT
jgi:hypothetical protein